MSVKYQIFISSTFSDLKDERKDITEAILDLDQIPSGMELFPASDETQFDYITKVIDECDYYILVIGGRYGSIDMNGISFTEREYDYAVSKQKTVLAFLHDDVSKLNFDKVDRDLKLFRKLEHFRKKVSKERLIKYWNGKEHLKLSVIAALASAMRRFPGTGWIRGDAAANSDILQQINELRIENERLRGLAEEQRLPKIGDLASLDEIFEVDYSYTDSHRKSHQSKLRLQWRSYFRLIGVDCMSPVYSKVYSLAITRYIKRNCDVVTVTLDYDAVIAMKFHFDAIGLIKMSVTQTRRDGMAEVVQTTEAGKSFLYQLLAVKSDQSKLPFREGVTANVS